MVKHFIPSTLAEALEFISNNETKIISGGTDLMVQRRSWAETPPKFDKDVIYIFNLKELNYIKKTNSFLRIGATTPVSDVLEHQDTPKLLKEAISIMASPALRNLATIAGNIGNASPAGDTLPIMYLYNAQIKLENKDDFRILPINEVILGPRNIILENNEMITEVIIPLDAFTKTNFTKIGGRKADAISKVSFTGALNVVENIVEDFRICFGAVGPTVVRNTDIENKYQNISLIELKANISNIIKDYDEIVKPIDDQRSTKEYRKKVALNLLKDFIQNI
jgi:CO/xanthine dehydrogenase FAD-binding subunit